MPAATVQTQETPKEPVEKKEAVGAKAATENNDIAQKSDEEFTKEAECCIIL